MKKRILEHLGSFMMSILLIILGILAFVTPQIFTGALVWIVGTILIAVGVFYMIFAFFMRYFVFGTIWMFLEGIVTVFIGVLITANPEGGIKFLSYVFAGWMLVSGLAQLFGSYDVRRYGAAYWWFSIIFGFIYIGFAITLFVFPKESFDVFRIILGIALILFGIIKIVDLLGIFKREKREQEQIKYMKKSVKEMNDHIDIDFTDKD